MTSTGALVKYLHQCLFSPPKRTLIKVIKNNQLATWPGLTARAEGDSLLWVQAHRSRGICRQGKPLLPGELPLGQHSVGGGADGVVTSGIGARCRVDWLVHMEPPFDETFKFSRITDVACSRKSSEEGGVCGKCAASRNLLLRRCTQTADLRCKPLHRCTTNECLQRTPSLVNKKVIA